MHKQQNKNKIKKGKQQNNNENKNKNRINNQMKRKVLRREIVPAAINPLGKIILKRLAIPPGCTCTVYSLKVYSYCTYSVYSNLLSSPSRSTIPDASSKKSLKV